MPGDVFRGASGDVAAVWREGSLYECDGITPLLTRRGGGWAVGREAGLTWRQQGNVILRGPSAEAFCRIVRDQVLKGSGYDVLYRLVGDAATRGNGRDIVVRGAGLTPEELVLAGLVFDRV